MNVFEREQYWKIKSKLFFYFSIFILFAFIGFFGTILNQYAVIENNGKMPVYDYKGILKFTETEEHVIYNINEKDKINAFNYADIFYMKNFLVNKDYKILDWESMYFSIGDILIVFFIFSNMICFIFILYYCFLFEVKFWRFK